MNELVTILTWWLLIGGIGFAVIFVVSARDGESDIVDEPQTLDVQGPDDR